MRMDTVEEDKYYYVIMNDKDIWAVFDNREEAEAWNMHFGPEPVAEVHYKTGGAIREFSRQLVRARKIAEGWPVYD